MKEIIIRIDVNVSKEKVWDLLFNHFGEVNDFNPLITGSKHTSGGPGAVGCERQCDLSRNNRIHERITAAREGESFDLEVIEGNMPMVDKMSATYDLATISSEKTRITFTARFSSRPAFMAGMMKGIMGKMLMQMLIGLKYHLETGGKVGKKNFKAIHKSYKRLGPGGTFSPIEDLVQAA